MRSKTNLLSAVWLVIKIASFQIAGVLVPHSGSGHFQMRLRDASHLIGRPFSLLTPVPCGPRHCGQFSAYRLEANNWAKTMRPNPQICGTRKALNCMLSLSENLHHNCIEARVVRERPSTTSQAFSPSSTRSRRRGANDNFHTLAIREPRIFV